MSCQLRLHWVQCRRYNHIVDQVQYVLNDQFPIEEQSIYKIQLIMNFLLFFLTSKMLSLNFIEISGSVCNGVFSFSVAAVEPFSLSKTNQIHI